METAKPYLEHTEPATEGLFKILNHYGWTKMRAIVETVNAKTVEALDAGKSNYTSVDVARDVIAGSILHIAYMAIGNFSLCSKRPDSVLRFEEKINEIIKESPKARRNDKDFELPLKYCVGRNVGELPIGLIIFAARNQYSHYSDSRLSVVNEVIFDYLNYLWPEPVKNDLSFNLRNKKYYLYSYAALCAIGWVDSSERLGYQAYKGDMASIFEVEF